MNPFAVEVYLNYKRHHIGTFTTINNAVLARNKWLIQHDMPIPHHEQPLLEQKIY